MYHEDSKKRAPAAFMISASCDKLFRDLLTIEGCFNKTQEEASCVESCGVLNEPCGQRDEAPDRHDQWEVERWLLDGGEEDVRWDLH